MNKKFKKMFDKFYVPLMFIFCTSIAIGFVLCADKASKSIKEQTFYTIEVLDKNVKLGGLFGGKTKYEITYRYNKYYKGKCKSSYIDTKNVEHYKFTQFEVGKTYRNTIGIFY